jgi:ethanolamine utilization protein EutN
MRIAKILGSVTLSRQHPSLVGGSLRLAVPLSRTELVAHAKTTAGVDAVADAPAGDSLVAWDDLGAATGSLVALSDGGEAAQPFRPALKPVDAYCAAILDNVHLPDRSN